MSVISSSCFEQEALHNLYYIAFLLNTFPGGVISDFTLIKFII